MREREGGRGRNRERSEQSRRESHKKGRGIKWESEFNPRIQFLFCLLYLQKNLRVSGDTNQKIKLAEVNPVNMFLHVNCRQNGPSREPQQPQRAAWSGLRGSRFGRSVTRTAVSAPLHVAILASPPTPSKIPPSEFPQNSTTEACLR